MTKAGTLALFFVRDIPSPRETESIKTQNIAPNRELNMVLPEGWNSSLKSNSGSSSGWSMVITSTINHRR